MIHHLSIPAELKSFAEDTCLLAGESRREFENIRCMIIDDVRPKTHIEWLWILDLAEMSWEILHYRCLKQKILESYRSSCNRSNIAATGRLIVPLGAVRLMELQEKGWSYVRPQSDLPVAKPEILIRQSRPSVSPMASCSLPAATCRPLQFCLERHPIRRAGTSLRGSDPVHRAH
jgi:hypothetical protein